MPPQNSDTSSLANWCGGLLTELKRSLLRLDDSNILSLSCGKLTGDMSFGNIVLTDSAIRITRDDNTLFELSDDGDKISFTLSSSAGDQYIKLKDDKLYIKCGVTYQYEKNYMDASAKADGIYVAQ